MSEPNKIRNFYPRLPSGSDNEARFHQTTQEAISPARRPMPVKPKRQRGGTSNDKPVWL